MKCPACDSTQARQIVVAENRMGMGDRFTYDVCRKCRLVRLVNPPADMSRYYQAYSYHRKTPSSKPPRRGIFAGLSQALLKPLGRYCPTDTSLKVLDVGCATGSYLADLKRRGFRTLTGIEPSAEAVNNRVDPTLNITCCSLDRWDAGETYDLVTLNGVFEHFERPVEMLEKLKTLLKPGATLVMCFPNYDSLARMALGSFWPGYDAPRHYFTYNPLNIRMLCERAGLKLGRVKHISRPSQFTGGFQYIWNRLSGRRSSLEDGFFRNSILLDLLFFPLVYLLNSLRMGDSIEVYVRRSTE